MKESCRTKLRSLQIRCVFTRHKDLTLMQLSMFEHTLPVCQAGSNTLSWALCERGHAASPRYAFHTHNHMHTHTYHSRRLGFAFPWQCAAAIFPRWQQCCEESGCGPSEGAISSSEEPRCSDTHWAHSSLDPSLPALMSACADAHPSQL